MVGNHSKSVRQKGSLTARPTVEQGRSQASDRWFPYGRAIAQRIKATLGITGLSPRVPDRGWHLDVGSSSWEGRSKGWAVHPLKRYATGFRTPVRRIRFIRLGASEVRGAVLSTRGPGWTHRWCTSCSIRASLGSCGRDKR